MLRSLARSARRAFSTPPICPRRRAKTAARRRRRDRQAPAPRAHTRGRALSWTWHALVAVDVAGHLAGLVADQRADADDEDRGADDEPGLRIDRRALLVHGAAGADHFRRRQQAHEYRADLLEMNLDVLVERIVALGLDAQ